MQGVSKGRSKHLYIRATNQVYGITTATILASVSKYLEKPYEPITFHGPYYVAK